MLELEDSFPIWVFRFKLPTKYYSDFRGLLRRPEINYNLQSCRPFVFLGLPESLSYGEVLSLGNKIAGKHKFVFSQRYDRILEDRSVCNLPISVLSSTDTFLKEVVLRVRKRTGSIYDN